MLFWRRKHRIRDEELNAYVDGQLDPRARARLEGHLETCAACRDALTELRAVRQALGALPRVTAPHSFALREADIRPSESPRSFATLGRAQAALSGVAAAAFLALGVLVGVDVVIRPDGAADIQRFQAEAEDAADVEIAAPVMEGGDRDLTGSAEGPELTDGENGVQALPETEGPRPAGSLPELPTPSSEPAPRIEAEATDNDRTSLRVAEVALAAVALVASGSLALVWWRRRA